MEHLKSRRLWIIFSFVVAIALLFSLRLFYLQVVRGEYYSELSRGSISYKTTVAAARGEILDRNGLPIVTNRTGFNVVLDKNFSPVRAEDQNAVLLRLVSIFSMAEEHWINNLPLGYAGNQFVFLDEREDDVTKLKAFLGLQTYATCDNVVSALRARYKLDGRTDGETLALAGIRYEMEQRQFSVYNTYTFAQGVSIETVVRIRENGELLPGVEIAEEAIRDYPEGSMLAHILGTVGPIPGGKVQEFTAKGYALSETVGVSGLEAYAEDILHGTPGERQVEKTSKGAILGVSETIAPVAGDNVVLTIDRELQRLVESGLKNCIEGIAAQNPLGQGSEANAGAAVVLDPKTGEILAIASYPTYDLSRFYIDYNLLKADTAMNPLVSRATAGLYAPGSCFKPTVAVAALSDGVISAQSHVTCGGRYTYFSAYQPRCMGVHGSTGVISALKVSCNVFFFDVGRRLGVNRMLETANQLGLGVYTGIETGEKQGQIASPAYRETVGGTWWPGDVIQTAIGQSDTAVTPLQIATYCAALSQDGVRYRTHLIKGTQNFLTGETIDTVQPIVAATSPLSPEAFETVRRGMVAASGLGGTAANAFLGYPVSVASKTGTAETGRASNNAIFIAYAPSEDPQIAVAIVVEKGGHGYFLTRFARDILDYWLFPETRGASGAPEEGGGGASSGAVTPGESGEAASAGNVPPVDPGTAD